MTVVDSTWLVQFDVVGVPAPQGSKRHVGRGILVESSKKVGPWRDAVAWAGREAMAGGDPHDGPLHLLATFRMPMPSSRRRPVCMSALRVRSPVRASRRG